MIGDVRFFRLCDRTDATATSKENGNATTTARHTGGDDGDGGNIADRYRPDNTRRSAAGCLDHMVNAKRQHFFTGSCNQWRNQNYARGDLNTN